MPFPNPFFMILYCPASGRAVNSMSSLPICERLGRLAPLRVCLRSRWEQIARTPCAPGRPRGNRQEYRRRRLPDRSCRQSICNSGRLMRDWKERPRNGMQAQEGRTG